MLGIGRNLSCLPVARAFLAGAALLAAAPAGQAHAWPEDVVLAIPRAAPHGAGGVALPLPLPPDEAARIRLIFAAQARGDLVAARRATRALDTSTRLGGAMLGQILADRLLSPHLHASPGALRAWLARYGDQPDAPVIHALLRRRVPRGAKLPDLPHPPVLLPDPPPTPVEDTLPAGHRLARNATLDRLVHDQARQGQTDGALRLIAMARGIAPDYAARLRAEVAHSLFTGNQDRKALDLAAQAAVESGNQDGLANYVAGLAAWRLDRPATALSHFEATSQAPLAPASLRAAASFWTARAHLHTHDLGGYMAWMSRAARQTRTFYGLLARHKLGLDWEGGPAARHQVLGEADIEAVAATPSGRLAFALLQVGQTARAEAALRHLAALSQHERGLRRAVMLVADKAEFYHLGAQLAAMPFAAPGQSREILFPVPSLRPRHGFRMDPALVYALTRLESNFDARAVSPVGARGLMQLMPRTASYIAADPWIASHADKALHIPAVNLDLGQRYVAYLAQPRMLDDDLIRVLASYNCGPGSFAKWNAAIRDQDDPLLFIEAIPFDETRAFVQRALAYTWIYARQFHLPAPSLDALAAGAFPHFAAPATLARGEAEATPSLH